MKRFIQGFAIALTLTSCAIEETKIVQKDTAAYHQVETQLQQPFLAKDQADVKMMIEKNHTDFSSDMVQCNYVEKYLNQRTCTSKKSQNNQSVAIKCVAADDLSYPGAERGACAKKICVNVSTGDCLREGNSAIDLSF